MQKTGVQIILYDNWSVSRISGEGEKTPPPEQRRREERKEMEDEAHIHSRTYYSGDIYGFKTTYQAINLYGNCQSNIHDTI